MKSTVFIALVTLVVGLASFNTKRPELIKTQLRISVLDDAGNFVEDAEVTLYLSISNYNEGKAAYESLKTDDKGQVIFKDVEAVSYYIEAKKGNMDNSFAGEMCKKLTPKKINKVNVIISE